VAAFVTIISWSGNSLQQAREPM